MSNSTGDFAPRAERPDQISHKLRNDVPLWVLCSVFALLYEVGYMALRGTLGDTTETTSIACNDVVKLAPKQANLTIALSWPRSTECEAVNELFSFDVDALSMSTDLDLADFMVKN